VQIEWVFFVEIPRSFVDMESIHTCLLCTCSKYTCVIICVRVVTVHISHTYSQSTMLIEHSFFRRSLLQKGPIILRSLLIVSHTYSQSTMLIECCFFCRALLQKRRVILRSLLVVPNTYSQSTMLIECCAYSSCLRRQIAKTPYKRY